MKLGACLKTRPVGAPGLQRRAVFTVSCRPRALMRRFRGVFKQALMERQVPMMRGQHWVADGFRGTTIWLKKQHG